MDVPSADALIGSRRRWSSRIHYGSAASYGQGARSRTHLQRPLVGVTVPAAPTSAHPGNSLSGLFSMLRSITRPKPLGDAVAGERSSSARTRGWVAALTFAVLAAGAAACASPDTDTDASASDPTPTPTSTSTPTPSKSDVASEKAVDAYLGFRDAQEAAGAIPDPYYEDLEVYATGEALAYERSTLLDFAQQGIVSGGETIYSPVVTDVRLEKPKSATIEDCIDISGVTVVNAETGESVLAPDQPSRVFSTAIMRRADGAWKVAEIDNDRSKKC